MATIGGSGKAGFRASTSLLGATLAIAAVTGCHAPNQLPSCAGVWRANNPIPNSYEGCALPSGASYASRPHFCSGQRVLVTYLDRLWGFTGQIAHAAPNGLAADPGYQNALSHCHS